MGRKRQRENAKEEESNSDSDEPVSVRRSELEEPQPKKSKWINKQRVLVFGCRGLSYRDRHLVRTLSALLLRIYLPISSNVKSNILSNNCCSLIIVLKPVCTFYLLATGLKC